MLGKSVWEAAPRSCTGHLRRLQDTGVKSHRARHIQCHLITVVATQGEGASRVDHFLESSFVEDTRLELAFKCLVVGIFWASVVAQSVKTLPAVRVDLSSIPGLGRSPGGGHGNSLQYPCLESPWTEEPGGLQSMGSQKVRHDWATKHSARSLTGWEEGGRGHLRQRPEIREKVLC